MCEPNGDKASNLALASLLLHDADVVHALAQLRVEALLRRVPLVEPARDGQPCLIMGECGQYAAFVIGANDDENGPAPLCVEHIASALAEGVFV